MDHMNAKRLKIPIGTDEIPVVIAHEGEEPKTVIMSYGSFLELWATLYVAVEALQDAGIDPDVLQAGRLRQTEEAQAGVVDFARDRTGGEA